MKFYCSRNVALAIVALAQLLAFNVVVRGQQPRRDDTYPPPDFLKKFQVHHDACVKKTGVSEEAIKQFSDGDAHDDPALRCYMNCIFHEVEIVDDNGEVHYEKLKAYIPANLKSESEHVMQILMACESHIPVGETLCDRAWSWHLCWKRTDAMHYFLP